MRSTLACAAKTLWGKFKEQLANRNSDIITVSIPDDKGQSCKINGWISDAPPNSDNVKDVYASRLLNRPVRIGRIDHTDNGNYEDIRLAGCCFAYQFSGNALSNVSIFDLGNGDFKLIQDIDSQSFQSLPSLEKVTAVSARKYCGSLAIIINQFRLHDTSSDIAMRRKQARDECFNRIAGAGNREAALEKLYSDPIFAHRHLTSIRSWINQFYRYCGSQGFFGVKTTNRDLIETDSQKAIAAEIQKTRLGTPICP